MEKVVIKTKNTKGKTCKIIMKKLQDGRVLQNIHSKGCGSKKMFLTYALDMKGYADTLSESLKEAKKANKLPISVTYTR